MTIPCGKWLLTIYSIHLYTFNNILQPLSLNEAWNIGHKEVTGLMFIATWDSHPGPPLLAGNISTQAAGDRVIRPGCQD